MESQGIVWDGSVSGFPPPFPSVLLDSVRRRSPLCRHQPFRQPCCLRSSRIPIALYRPRGGAAGPGPCMRPPPPPRVLTDSWGGGRIRTVGSRPPGLSPLPIPFPAIAFLQFPVHVAPSPSPSPSRSVLAPPSVPLFLRFPPTSRHRSPSLPRRLLSLSFSHFVLGAVHIGYAPPPPPPNAGTTKTRSDPQRVRMSSGGRPIGTAKGKTIRYRGLVPTPPLPAQAGGCPQ